ncbi:hypothetical protein [Kribbella flavida]|uniref:hypothetical protein n=1 Tax=Kribbella flavida TaxID=182640 RepID=UPI00019BE5E4|nr:hypothetical protein [Kribbella flavida]
MLSTLEAPQLAADRPPAPRAALYALVDRPRLHWLRLTHRSRAEVVTAAVALTLSATAFTLANLL